MGSAELSMKKFYNLGASSYQLPNGMSEQVGSKPINPLFFRIRSNTLRQSRIHGQLSFEILLQLLNMLPLYFIARSR